MHSLKHGCNDSSVILWGSDCWVWYTKSHYFCHWQAKVVFLSVELLSKMICTEIDHFVKTKKKFSFSCQGEVSPSEILLEVSCWRKMMALEEWVRIRETVSELTLEDLPSRIYFQSHGCLFNWFWHPRWGNNCNSSPHKNSEWDFTLNRTCVSTYDKKRSLVLNKMFILRGIVTNQCQTQTAARQWQKQQNNLKEKTIVKW